MKTSDLLRHHQRDSNAEAHIVVLAEKMGESGTLAKRGEQDSQEWDFSKSDPPTKDTEKIVLYHGWNDRVLTLTYANLYYQQATAAGPGGILGDNL
jgi:hypothetical protein